MIFANRKNGRLTLRRMDNVGIVVESIDAAISFFGELGLELEGRAMIEGDWSGRVTGLRDQRVEIAGAGRGLDHQDDQRVLRSAPATSLGIVVRARRGRRHYSESTNSSVVPSG